MIGGSAEALPAAASGTPAPDVVLFDFTLAGPVLAVRPYTHNDNYWQVYFDTNEMIVRVCGGNSLDLDLCGSELLCAIAF